MSLYNDTLALAVKYRSLADQYDADYIRDAHPCAVEEGSYDAGELHEMADQLVALAYQIQILEMAHAD